MSEDPEVNSELERLDTLIVSAKSGTDAFDQLYDHFFPKIYNFVVYRVGDQEVAEDLTSDIFYKMIAKFDDFAGNAKAFTTWIYQIARNTVTDYYRLSGRKTQVYYVASEDLSLHADMSQDVEESVENHDKIVRIRELISEMKPEEQEILSLRFFDGLDNKSIAEIIGIKAGTLNVKLHRALEKLKHAFEHSFQENHA